VASLSQGRTAAAQCGLFTYKSVPVVFEPPFIYINKWITILCLMLESTVVSSDYRTCWKIYKPTLRCWRWQDTH